MARMTRSRRLFAVALMATLVDASAAAQTPPAASEPQAKPFDQVAALAELKAAIAGREEMPAVEVFKNIKQYRNATAGRFLRIMEYGYTVSLGVDCTHCHIPGQWDSDEKAAKQIARDMKVMLGVINDDLLKKIPNLRSTNPSVNCSTCHRGQTRPALEVPGAPKPPGR